ncbi:ANR family transcriptional regulator [Serratia marcescens]|uniref:ANR family transcriptional regulator n=1 Tax=Serratia marcescens TaxID=615 RepID=UPI0013DD5682|nr:ANR family transcriptional regulator [Serratia marcescens]NGH10031.1 ANR family transcriptional regulator [Serratia marcescens]
MWKRAGEEKNDGGHWPELHVMSTPGERLRATLQKAAALERAGCFDDAAAFWLARFELARQGNERHWCEVRALLCQKRSAEPRR